MADIVFYHNPQSRGRIAHWMLEEVGVPYQTELLRFDRGEHKKPQFLAINPMGKIPTIKHGDVVVTEAAAICAYLADAFPAANLAPATTSPARGTYYRWLFFGAGCVEPALVDRLFKRPPVDRPGALGYGSYEDTLHALEHAVSTGKWILGEQFSAADVYVGSEIAWGMLVKAIEPRPAFQEYVARCAERPAFKRAVAQNEQYMKELA
ncbi:MAG TPA: glutathione S-transferase family protein [Steroidobacter sp.]|uniref:glutathione S-transferase family protein n=1 Tax=Steroidobacter sp. TaxID=1978227 RepID=UPI002ED824F5